MIRHIRIVSPSGVIDPAYIDGASARLRAWGYIVSEGAHARDARGRFAGCDEDRLADLTEALNETSVDAILCARGGYGLQRIIDRVPPITKPVIGFSDITALHQKAAMNGCSTIHGIMCKHIATLPEDSEPIQALRKILAGEPVSYQWDTHPLNREGKAEGFLIGGNLSVLYGLQGTAYGLKSVMDNGQWTMDNRPILLIEDVGERHYHIDRMMRNLRMSGVLAQLSGLIVGQFSDCEDDELMGCTVYETIKEAVADYDYPVLFNAPVGHMERNLPLPMNVPTRMEITTSSALIDADGIA